MELTPGYKYTEVGVIPNDWDIVPLSSTAKRIARGASPRPIDSPLWFDDRSSIGWVRISDVTRSRRYLEETTQRLSDAGIQSSRFVGRGGLIMSICATVGRPIETRIDSCIHDGFVVFEEPKIDQSFLYHVLASMEPTWSGRGQTGSQMNLNTGLIKDRLVAIPSTTTEQHAIAAALSDTDALLDGLDRLIVKKRDLKRAAMQQLLIGQTRLPGFHVKWQEKRLADIASPRLEKNTAVEKLPVLTCSKHLGFVDSLKYFRNQVFSNDLGGYRIIRRGEIGYPSNHVEEGSIGFQDLYDVALVSPIYVVFAAAKNINSYFLYRLLKLDSYRQKFKLATTASVDRRGSLRWPAFSEITVRIPSPSEQTAIARVLADMDAELAALEARRDKTRDLKQGMMEELLTGRTRLI